MGFWLVKNVMPLNCERRARDGRRVGRVGLGAGVAERAEVADPLVGVEREPVDDRRDRRDVDRLRPEDQVGPAVIAGGLGQPGAAAGDRRGADEEVVVAVAGRIADVGDRPAGAAGGQEAGLLDAVGRVCPRSRWRRWSGRSDRRPSPGGPEPQGSLCREGPRPDADAPHGILACDWNIGDSLLPSDRDPRDRAASYDVERPDPLDAGRRGNPPQGRPARHDSAAKGIPLDSYFGLDTGAAPPKPRRGRQNRAGATGDFDSTRATGAADTHHVEGRRVIPLARRRPAPLRRCGASGPGSPAASDDQRTAPRRAI